MARRDASLWNRFRHPLGLVSAWLVLFALPISHAGESEPDILGYTEPYKTITVSAGEQGVIAEMLVEEGAQVKKDQVLARLDNATLHADLEIARAEAKLQGTRLQKLDELAKANRASRDELERAQTDLTVKEAQVRKIEAQIEARTMRTPVDGVVIEIKRDPSEAVSAANPHVLTVVQVDKLLVNLFLPPSHAAVLQTGSTVNLLLLEGQRISVPAKVEFISSVTDSASGTVRVKFVIDNASGTYRSGVRCTLEK
ncbi:efflux RND transporter periplasmic adaptor subunit [Roseimicrobium sp. ORNL1]|uniref:efflux RND transporter periplasmic adaptor subunit n=1 Tax=Roseimicrobium sp. ORNL1 TaxID=2711231 RepID=UPI0013E13AC4|nr:efflux RND transporter periplasmic adaptor subunit [Roseimicrobium sp. ORNL1]QIF03832.1 efflux RND transporter periplasmic adaptor subunit [Roseimicrobium sp. ORNL1]